MNMAEQLELNCLVYDDEPGHIFPVKIASTESVGTLKEAIKEKRSPLFDAIPADHIVLWGVSISADSDELLQEELSNCLLDNRNSLRPRERLAKVFPSINEEDLHVIIRIVPPLLELSCSIYGDEPSDVFTVKIARTESVHTLKEAIREKNQYTFRDLDAHSLKLWNMSLKVYEPQSVQKFRHREKQLSAGKEQSARQ